MRRIITDSNGKVLMNNSGGVYETQVEAPENDVNFYDYDGFRVASYTIAEAKALTQAQYNAILPPSHDGLTFQEWNWTLNDIQTYDRQYADIGANYTTTDGKTHIFAVIDGEVNLTFYGKKGVLTLDWGDGTTISHTFSSIGGNQSFTHTYTELGYKNISVAFEQDSTDGYFSFSGVNATSSAGWFGIQAKEIRFGNFCAFTVSNNLSYSLFDTKYSLANNSIVETIDIIASYFKTLVIPRKTSISFVKIQASICEHLIFPKNIGNFGNNGYSFYQTNLSGRAIIPSFTNTSPLHLNTFVTFVTAIVSLPSCTSFATAGAQINLANLYYLDIAQGWTPNVSMILNTSQRWSAENMVKFFNKLGTTTDAITLTFGSVNLNKLTADQKAIATNKGYTLA